ncbi:hypothetical protein AB0I28_14560 [Phytomonospora sp. NPDC050363]|uniref:hypothetical protein n=1 Tax=Phytomonospora sp. NPDC050363 TaxID=3155642 RepID=UPI0033C14B6B
MTDVKRDAALATAAGLLGTGLSDPVDLGGSSRSAVMRARRADGGTVVVRAHDLDQPEALRRFAAEAAGLAFSPRGPRLLAADRGSAVTVMSDLGSWPNLADVLLGDDPAAATTALLAWARAYGGIARESLERGAELDALLDRYGGGDPSWNDSPWIAERLPGFAVELAALGIPVPPGLHDDLAAIGALTRVGPRVFSPGDICPDNNLLTDAGLRVVDFEGAGYHSAYLDSAYVTMPFATCWCAFGMPGEVAAEVESAYWTELTGAGPTEADRAGIRLAVAAWTLDLTRFLLPKAAAADGPMHPARRPIGTKRQVLRHRWRLAGELLSAAGELPAVAEACGALLRFSEGWGTSELGVYPAFAGGPFSTRPATPACVA